MLTPLNLSPPTFSLFTLIIIIIFTLCNGRLIHARIFIYAGCSQDKYPPNSPYEANKISLLSSVAASSAQTLFNSFTSTAPPDAAVYGLYQCRGDLKSRDCAACVADIISKVELLCPDTYGASLQLDGCYLRYEHTDFVGKLDTGLRYKKCGGGGGNDAEFLRRRDDVLANLRGADGFRVSTAGAVEGYAQCLGDVAAPDCSVCLGEAVAEVKTLCGSAAAGDVFLAQCYVRYWESGYYDSSSDSSNQDDVGKTVAISVGVVAGVAVLVVLLSFCRKAVG